eukprot:gnl/TRDRNA2_/TRDRNA2_198281_c0_seq1.p1 gnl/TRDRNA2_/TRDRNA2_198281_c0~~gnl/TRDRNA2_/TRDRNA2_198281_c0_seq1.p1  ORF type:complete len:610 (+),score=109.73 gnl/TRDRNA2_/TRDRNA2_198281_c0_seq1:31-1860(+)
MAPIAGRALEEIAWTATASTCKLAAKTHASCKLENLPKALQCEQCGDISGDGRLGATGTRDSCRWFCSHCWNVWDAETASVIEPQELAGSPNSCGRCGWQAPTSRPPPFCDAVEAWLCPSCWLRADAAANPFRALDAEESWIMQALAFADQFPPDLAQLQCNDGENVELCEEDTELGGSISLIWDASDRSCAVIVSALVHSFGRKLLRLVNFHDRDVLDRLLARHPGIPWVPLCCHGGVSAVLQTGIFISGVERHPKVLLYELKYRRSVIPANRDYAHQIEQMYLKPLAMLRESFLPACQPLLDPTGYWWYEPSALATITKALATEKYVIIDGFLPDMEYERLRVAGMAMGRGGQLHRGNRGGGRRVEEDGADLLNACNRPRKWTMWDDNVAYCSDDDSRAPPVGSVLTVALDALVSRLRDGGRGVHPAVSERLKEVYFREKVMVACYRAETCGRYFQHVDSAGGAQRLLTTILYLNADWQYADGGFNRLYKEGWFNKEVKADILPVANRLLVFWADDDCPHEVTACPRRDRYAMTVWFAKGATLLRERLHSTEGRRELVEDFHPVRPCSFLEAALRAAPHLEGDERVLETAEWYDERYRATKSAVIST